MEEIRLQEDMLSLLRALAPEQTEEIGRRAQVLTAVESLQPVGRRALAAKLNLPEREVRAAAASLKDQGLLRMDAAGMQLTDKAKDVLPGAQELSRSLFGLTRLENALERLLGIAHVTVVAGDADRDPRVLKDAGRAAAHRLHRLMMNGMTVAVTGGSTMYSVACGFAGCTPVNVMVVPARGGMGSDADTQANAVAADFAQRLNGRYRMIHLPDSLTPDSLEEMRRLPGVEEALELLGKADLVVHGIGRADTMAGRRGLPKETVELLRKKGAVGEAFGDFFNEKGETVWQTSTVSTEIGRTKNTARMVAVAAGSAKAEAIIASARHEKHDSLITDQGAAEKIIALLSEA